MRFLFTILMASWMAAVPLQAKDLGTVRIITPEWAYYTQKDGSGLYQELWRQIFEPAGVRYKVQYALSGRCEIEVQEKRSHAYPGVYAGDPGFIIPKWHIGVDLITAVFKKGAIDKWTGQKVMENRRVGWERGYRFDKTGVVTVRVKKVEFNRLASALQMLVMDRVDIILDYPQAVDRFVRELGISDQVEILPDVIHGPKYYMGFVASEKGRALARIWDEGMERLSASGELQALYRKYQDKSY